MASPNPIPASTAARIRQLLAERRSGHTLPQAFYLDADLLEADLAGIFHQHWLQVALEAELPRPGDYVTLSIGRSPIVLVRNGEGQVSGFFNTCRHRGAQICDAERGHVSRLVCPYHQWTYDFAGKLVRAPLMPEGFDKSTHGLKPIRVEVVAGVIFVCLSETPTDFEPIRKGLSPLIEAYELHNTKVAHTAVLYEQANWKLVMENARECYHCRARHPQFMRTFPDFTNTELYGTSGSRANAEREPSLARFWQHCEAMGLRNGPVELAGLKAGRLPLSEGALSVTGDGQPAVTKTLGRLTARDVGTLRWSLEPNSFSHAFCDYAFFFQAWPTGPQETFVSAKWVVHKDAVEGIDYTLERLTDVWDATNNQDRWLAENNQKGVNSVAYTPGPYSSHAEGWLMDFVDWYCDALDALCASERVTSIPHLGRCAAIHPLLPL